MVGSSTVKLLSIVSVLLEATVVIAQPSSMFDTNFVELDASKMIHTSDSHYAISSPSLPSNWRSISVNGNYVTTVSRTNQMATKQMGALTNAERASLNSLKATLTSVIRLGPFNVKSQTGLAKLTTFDRFGGSSTMGSGGGSSSSSSSSSSSGSGMSVSKTGPNSFIVTKPDLPFNWQRVFVNDDNVAVVYHDGRVVMLPQTAMRPDEKAKIDELRVEVNKSTQVAENMTKSFSSSSFSNPMDFVNKALGGMFG